MRTKRITEREVAALKPGADKYDKPTGVRGLQVVVTPKGQKTWSFRQAGSPRVKLGEYPAMSLEQATRAAERARHAHEEGKDIRPQVVKSGTVEELADQFQEHQRKRGVRESHGNACFIRKDILPAIGKRRVVDVRRKDILAITDAILERGSPATANQVFGLLRLMFNYALERELITASPVAGLKKPTKTTSRDRWLEDDELRRVWRAADAMGFPFGLIVQGCIATGCRRGELSEATWSEFDLSKRQWTIPSHRTKNSEPHIVPLSDLMLEVLAKLPRFVGDDRLFPAQRGGEGTASGFSRAKERLDELSGVEAWLVHDTRRTVAVGLQRLGLRLEVIETVLGHTTSRRGIVGTYQRYGFQPEARAALEAWSHHLRGLIAPESSNVVALR